ncbi:MAG: hypothetical protein RLZZ359_605 [Actinomycetota bacterium]|jgi:chloramphenicol-sensitive protein RarD
MQISKSPDQRRGFFFGITAYGIWGSFPLIVSAVSFASPWEIVAWRIVFGFLLAAAVVTFGRMWPKVKAVLKDRHMRNWQLAATALILINWEVYIYAVSQHNTIEAALGYFINPLVTIALGMIFLGEKLNTAQKVATAIGLIASVVLTIDYGRPPLVALSLAASFGLYGLAKSKLGGKVSPVISYSIESGVLLPVAILQLALVGLTQPGIAFATQGFWGMFGLVMFGFFTAIPLIMFGSAAKHLPLKYVGFIQYLTPILQFATAYFLFHEPMPPARWIGFILVWASLAVLSADALRGIRRR